ncbi:hypothetical protein [Streptomyces sp. CB03911]|uniref:hypothetical protein n=1 Tax=Streptomyces sp. CB03911 TaxID=1804758 RepID=UPI0018FEC85B|nr:hypothetical protein [Streptomyces sp. CB03911]
MSSLTSPQLKRRGDPTGWIVASWVFSGLLFALVPTIFQAVKLAVSSQGFGWHELLAPGGLFFAAAVISLRTGIDLISSKKPSGVPWVAVVNGVGTVTTLLTVLCIVVFSVATQQNPRTGLSVCCFFASLALGVVCVITAAKCDTLAAEESGGSNEL